VAVTSVRPDESRAVTPSGARPGHGGTGRPSEKNFGSGVENPGPGPTAPRKPPAVSEIKKGEQVVKYILMMSGTKGDFEWYVKWSKEDLQAHFAFMQAFNKELKDSGVLVAAEGLAFPDQAKVVRAGNNGEPITDGVFPESKEFLAGFWVVDVDSPEQAYQLAA